MDVEIKKGGQVAIFIIMAIVVVAGILMAVFFVNDFDVIISDDLDARAFMDKCVRDSVEVSVDKMLRNGGEILPTRTIMYRGEEWNYLCYQDNYYLPCFNVHPMLEVQIEGEIARDSAKGIVDCFDSMRVDFEERGFDVGCEGACGTVYTIDLVPGNVEVILRKEFYISRDGAVQNFDDFGVEIASPIYDLVGVARRIINDETSFSGFDFIEFAMLYPEYEVERVDYSSSTLYSVGDRETGYEFKFAVRGFVSPPGFL